MPKRSKFFRVAVEGATCDGRTLDRAALQEMADTYNTATYTARVNMEHIRGFSADPPFHAYGDVVALKTEQVDIQLGGKTEKKLGLFAQVDALDNLVALNAKGQKLYPSIELNPNFASTGKAYLQGLAVTDSPASLGTEVMQFAAGAGEKNPFAARKVEKSNFFSAADEGVTLEFEEAAPAQSEHASFFAAAADFFKSLKPGATPPEPATPPAPPPPANDNDARFSAVASGLEKMAGGIEAMGNKFTADVAALRGEIAGVKTSIETTDASSTKRPPATGAGGNYAVTDF